MVSIGERQDPSEVSSLDNRGFDLLWLMGEKIFG